MVRANTSLQRNLRHREVSVWRSLDPADSEKLPLFITRSGCARWVGKRSYSRSSSEATVLELVLGGNAIYVEDHQKHVVKTGEAVILRAKSQHSYTTGPAGFVHKRYINIDGPALEGLLRATGLANQSVVSVADVRALERLFRAADRLLKERSGNFRVEVASLVFRILVELGQSVVVKRPYAVTRALEFMHAHESGHIRLSELTKVAGMSETHFSSVFKQHTGMAPLQYFLRIKLTQAKRMLAETDATITQISKATGATDAMYFSRQFKKHTGSSPTIWRANARREERPESNPADAPPRRTPPPGRRPRSAP
jgi:AraC family transcriptional regulator of arabinose operon